VNLASRSRIKNQKRSDRRPAAPAPHHPSGLTATIRFHIVSHRDPSSPVDAVATPHICPAGSCATWPTSADGVDALPGRRRSHRHGSGPPVSGMNQQFRHHG
jgi:hypothetical protein